MTLVRLARQVELGGTGSRLVRETHGRQIMIVRTGEKVYAMDPACYHMGGNLYEGDIEDVSGSACIVCPLHKHRLALATGKRMDRDLCGSVCASHDQKQRTYDVFQDSDSIWVSIPDLTQPSLPSDMYNPVRQYTHQSSTPARGLGLGGLSAGGTTPPRGLGPAASSSQGPPATPPPALEPYSGMFVRPMVPSPEQLSQESEMEMQLSQPDAVQLTQGSSQGSPLAATVPPTLHAPEPGRINFPAQRAGLVRSRLAREAILKKAYAPPMAAAPALPHKQQQQPAPAPHRQGSGQQSLFAFGFTAQPRQVSTGLEDMET